MNNNQNIGSKYVCEHHTYIRATQASTLLNRCCGLLPLLVHHRRVGIRRRSLNGYASSSLRLRVSLGFLVLCVPRLSVSCMLFNVLAPWWGTMAMAPWQAVASNNVTCQECQLTVAAPGVSDNLHGTGGSHHPVGGSNWLLRECFSRVEGERGMSVC